MILGSTYTGHFEPVEEVSKVLDEYEKDTGISIPIHVDGASGAMVAPFTGAQGKWGFELPRVHSINTSGHKFGLVYAGLGWIVWRNEEYLPKDLIFELHYLGGTEQSYTLNFSRPGNQVIAQYFNFIHLGREGFTLVMRNALQNARVLSKALEASGWYVCLSDIHRKRGLWGDGGTGAKIIDGVKDLVLQESDPSLYNSGLPVVSFRFNDEFRKTFPHIKQQSVSTLLRTKGYIIPSTPLQHPIIKPINIEMLITFCEIDYNLPPSVEEIEILRVVVRESMSADLLDRSVVPFH